MGLASPCSGRGMPTACSPHRDERAYLVLLEQGHRVHELCRLRMRLELRRHPRHGGTSLLVTTSEQRDPPPSMEPVSHRKGAAASPKAARTARRAPEAGAPGASACCWYL
jgi:hypothetical protein